MFRNTRIVWGARLSVIPGLLFLFFLCLHSFRRCFCSLPILNKFSPVLSSSFPSISTRFVSPPASIPRLTPSLASFPPFFIHYLSSFSVCPSPPELYLMVVCSQRRKCRITIFIRRCCSPAATSSRASTPVWSGCQSARCVTGWGGGGGGEKEKKKIKKKIKK